jgi:hypothetical protein
MTFITGSTTVLLAGLSAAAGVESLFAAEANGKVASCAASVQQTANRKNCFVRTLKLALDTCAMNLFMDCELPMLV